MANIANLLTEHMDIWTAADTRKKSGRGRASGNAGSVYGVKKLRELILELAMRGKLVPQDPSDEPASELLKRIKAKTVKQLALIKQNSYELPKGWEWVHFGEIAQHNSGKTLDKGRNSGILRDYITTSNLYWGKFELDNVKQMPIEKSELERCSARKNDLLICEGGEAGRAAVWTFDKEVCFQNHVHRARMHEGISPFYAYRYFEKLNATGEIEQYRKGVGISNMSGKALASVIFALPPKAEQQRIVAKVDELMVLCDQLEQQHSNAQEAHETLVSQLLATLTQSQNAAEFNANWQRIYAHFDVLFTTEASIDALKQTLLQLAVMGKLVPQDLNDELASEILKRINACKVKSNSIWLDFNGLDELKKCLPSQWVWVRLGEIADIVRGGSPRPAGDLKFYDGNIPFLKVGDVTRSKGKMVDGFTSTIKPAGLTKTRFINIRTVLLTNSGATLGVPAICDFETTFNDGIAAFINLSPEIFDEYLYLYLKSISAWFLNVAAQGQGQPNLNTDIIRSTWIPLTSIQQQKRIVAKVDALMALCDQLKTRIQEASKQQKAIADTFVGNLIGAPITKIKTTSKMDKNDMRIIAPLVIRNNAKLENDAILANIIKLAGGKLESKSVWQASKLELKDFYKQLKLEIDAGYIQKPLAAISKEAQ